MKQTKILATLFVSGIILVTNSASAARRLSGSVTSGYKVLAISNSKSDVSTGSTRFSIDSPDTKAKMYLLNSSGTLSGPVVAAVKYQGVYYTYSQAKNSGICRKSGARLVMGIKPRNSNLRLGKINHISASGFAYMNSLLANSKYDSSSTVAISNTRSCSPAATGKSLGLLSTSQRASLVKKNNALKITASSEDQDKDGIVDILDIDLDNDGILNAYDSSTVLTASASKFYVFSNLKLGIENSLNAYIQTLSSTQINDAAESLTLAMQVAGTSSDTTELNCNGLSYCSTGGTGTYSNLSFPDSYDGDSDGYGQMTRGGAANDFQLATNASSVSEINAGDTFSQIVTDGSANVTEYSGMLNFVFRTTPAISSLSMGSSSFTPTYPPTAGMEGSTDNPFVSPASWDGVLTVTAYRPQRKGIRVAGEGAQVDIGKSLVTIDIPNAPCSTAGACSGTGPNNCSATAYTESDPELISDTNGLKDIRSDQDTDTSDPASNRVTFSIDLDACLAAASTPITWNVGEKLAIDLQFRNSAGDNAAQKFYIQKQ